MEMVEFSQLPYREQVNTVCESGTFLVSRRVEKFLVALYQLDGFYIELYFLSGATPLQKLEFFSDTERLAPYLDKININRILPPL